MPTERVNPELLLQMAKERHPHAKWEYEPIFGCCRGIVSIGDLGKYGITYTQLEATHNIPMEV